MEDRLENIEELQKQTLWLLKGSENLGIEGVVPALKRMDKTIEHLEQDFRDQEKLREWRRDLFWTTAKIIGGVITAIGVIGGLLQFILL